MDSKVLWMCLCLLVRSCCAQSSTDAISKETNQPTQPASKLTDVTDPVTVSGTTDTPATTLTPEQRCAARNSSCETCIADVECYYCQAGSLCRPYPYNHVFPSSDDCALSDARWGVCWLNYKDLIIAMGTIGAVLLLGFALFIYCCCCRSKKRWGDEEASIARKREELRLKHSERQADRQTKNDEMRRKYGLIKTGGNNPYKKFED